MTNSIQNLREDQNFEALFQGVVHHCTFNTEVEARVEEQLSHYTQSYEELAEYLYDFLVTRGAVRVAVRRYIQEGLTFSESKTLYLRHRGFLDGDGEFNPFIARYFSMRYGVTPKGA